MKIKNGLVFSADHTMKSRDLCFENGVITENSLDGEYDATDCYVLPGFIDTHIHGAGGVEFYECEYSGDLKKSLDYLTKCGVTSILVTLAIEQYEEYVIDCQKIVKAADATDRGELTKGYRADVIILDKDFNVKDVFLKGELVAK